MTHDLSTPAGRLFVSQSLLDAWVGQGRIDVDGTSLALAPDAGRQRRYALEPAVRFLRVVGGGEDAHGLVSRVKSLAQVREMGFGAGMGLSNMKKYSDFFELTSQPGEGTCVRMQVFNLEKLIHPEYWLTIQRGPFAVKGAC